MDFPGGNSRCIDQEKCIAVEVPITVGWSSHVISSLTVEEAAKEMQRDTHFADYQLNTRSAFSSLLAGWQVFFPLRGRAGDIAQRESKYNSEAAVLAVTESSFDGERFYCSSQYGSEKPRRVLRDTLAIRAARDLEARYGNGDYFEAVGFIMPSRVKDLQQRAPVRSKVLGVLEDAGELVGLDEVVILRAERLSGFGSLLMTIQIRRAGGKSGFGKSENPELKPHSRLGRNQRRYRGDQTSATTSRRNAWNVFYLDPQLNYGLRPVSNGSMKFNSKRALHNRLRGFSIGTRKTSFHLPTKCIDGGGKVEACSRGYWKSLLMLLPEQRFSLKDICNSPGTVIP